MQYDKIIYLAFFITLLTFAFGTLYYIGILTTISEQVAQFNNEFVAKLPNEIKGLVAFLVFAMIYIGIRTWND